MFDAMSNTPHCPQGSFRSAMRSVQASCGTRWPWSLPLCSSSTLSPSIRSAHYSVLFDSAAYLNKPHTYTYAMHAQPCCVSLSLQWRAPECSSSFPGLISFNVVVGMFSPPSCQLWRETLALNLSCVCYPWQILWLVAPHHCAGVHYGIVNNS